MKKPEVKTKRFLDWVELQPYLLKNGFGKNEIHTLSDMWRDGGIHNGCFITVPRQYDDDEFYSEESMEVVKRFTDFLFEQFPDAVDHYDEIEIWYWW